MTDIEHRGSKKRKQHTDCLELSQSVWVAGTGLRLCEGRPGLRVERTFRDFAKTLPSAPVPAAPLSYRNQSGKAFRWHVHRQVTAAHSIPLFTFHHKIRPREEFSFLIQWFGPGRRFPHISFWRGNVAPDHRQHDLFRHLRKRHSQTLLASH